jgi:hypothetical protein
MIFLEEFPTGVGMNRQLFCIKKELKNAANMLNNYTMQMQTLINQSYRSSVLKKP